MDEYSKGLSTVCARKKDHSFRQCNICVVNRAGAEAGHRDWVDGIGM